MMGAENSWGPMVYGIHGLFSIFFLVVLVIAIIWLVRVVVHHDTSRLPPSSFDRALDILRQRYAKGEIDRDEYEAMKRDLGEG